jgi:hypothetical protein
MRPAMPFQVIRAPVTSRTGDLPRLLAAGRRLADPAGRRRNGTAALFLCAQSIEDFVNQIGL